MRFPCIHTVLCLASLAAGAERFEGKWKPDVLGTAILSGIDEKSEIHANIKDIEFSISSDQIIFNSWAGKHAYRYEVLGKVHSVPGIETQFSVKLKESGKEELAILIYYANDTLMFRSDKGLTCMFDRHK